MGNDASPPAASDADIDAHIAQRLQALRAQRQFSLAQLAERSGVSKGMISKVERAQSSPTAALLGRLAAGLGVPLTQLLAPPPAAPQRLRPLALQALWTDPQLGYMRRQVRARDPRQGGAELVEVQMPRATQVSYPAWSGQPYTQVQKHTEKMRVQSETINVESLAGRCAPSSEFVSDRL